MMKLDCLSLNYKLYSSQIESLRIEYFLKFQKTQKNWLALTPSLNNFSSSHGFLSYDKETIHIKYPPLSPMSRAGTSNSPTPHYFKS